MPSPLSRRSFVAAGGSGLTLLLAACSTGPAAGGASRSVVGIVIGAVVGRCPALRKGRRISFA